MRDRVYLGASPFNEDCAQLGRPGYRERALKELAELKRMMIEIHPPVGGGFYKVSSESHDFGIYYELVAVFDDNDDEQASWAFAAEDKVPEYWDEQAKVNLGIAEGSGIDETT